MTKVWVLVCKTLDEDCAGVIDVFATQELALEDMKRCYSDEAEGDDDAAPFDEAVTHYTGGDGAWVSYVNDDGSWTWEITSHVVT